MIHDNLTPAEIAEMIARYRYNAVHDADRIKRLEEQVGELLKQIEQLKTTK